MPCVSRLYHNQPNYHRHLILATSTAQYTPHFTLFDPTPYQTLPYETLFTNLVYIYILYVLWSLDSSVEAVRAQDNALRTRGSLPTWRWCKILARSLSATCPWASTEASSHESLGMANGSVAVWGKPGYRLKKQNFHQIAFRNQSASVPKTLQSFENRDFQSDIFLKISSLL